MGAAAGVAALASSGGGGGGLGDIGSLPGTIFGGITGQTAANTAAAAQRDAANQANSTQLAIFNTQNQNAQPWLQAGQGALKDLQGQMPDLTRQFSTTDFHKDPGYQFTLDQGMQAMQRSAAAKGMLNSVGTMQNLNNYAQGQASNQYQNAFNRFTQSQNQRYNMLSGLAGTGQVATGQMASAGQNYANQYGQNMSGIGNANAAAAMQGYNGAMGLVKNGATLAMLA